MAKLSPQAAEATTREWRELGFFYVSDDDALEWRLTGSRDGLLRFASALEAYAADPAFAPVSEHQQFGPHMYLEVMTWSEAGIDGHSIHGTQDDIGRFGRALRSALASASPGQIIRFKEEFTLAASYALVLHVMPANFDPASADPQLGV